ncbi:DUF6318 family protein [Kineococcus sp. SYSU DK005]|uniref:DUF6318 family protein n=1 Tax=Kineococcus sp. SYSU DK005 TaxID=3383126 RepID=UPI003D7DCBC5
MFARRPLLLPAAVLTALAGCGAGGPGDQRPSAPAPPPAAPAPVATPAPASATATAPAPAVAQPPAARPTFTPVGFDEDDAIAFAAHYLKVLNHARATGDSDAIREISEPDCVACRNDAEVVDVAHARGLRWENIILEFRGATVEHFDPEFNEAEILMRMRASSGRLVNPDGTTLQESPGSESDGSMQLKFHDDQWWIWEMPR